MRSLKRIFRQRMEGKNIQGDILQESFINTMPAWVNMLLLSSSGPIKTPVGACATAAESVEIGYETIRSGKARIVVVGGYDDFGEEGSYEFGNTLHAILILLLHVIY
jgi:fatty acid synthase subunit beta